MLWVGQQCVTDKDAGLVLQALVLGEDELGDVDSALPAERLLEIEARL